MTTEPTNPIPFLQPWLQDLKNGYDTNITDEPNYYIHNPSSHLQTSSNIHSFQLGTGVSIYSTLESLLESANHEIILVTCFWARSETQQILNRTLLKLSSKAASSGRKIRVRICFSSSSIFQKLFHPQGTAGKVYAPSTWTSTLGLPDPEQLTGLDLQIKSIFLLPFSVMHPKFVVVDRKVAVLPSCNVSWEEWFEGAVTLTGPVVSNFVAFWREFWAETEDRETELFALDGDVTVDGSGVSASLSPLSDSQHATSSLPLAETLDLKNIPTLFLPSPHHRNPQFRFPWQDSASPPPTPLNTFILRAIRSAERELYIQTPNLTAAPVLSAILQALARGIDIHIITSARLMILEQLVTAGTTTSHCITNLQKRYQRLLSTHTSSLEQGLPRPGKLEIEFFEPKEGKGEPQQSHLKCLVVDRELVLLGSGNLDRASWFTSQELGVAFFDRGFASRVLGCLDDVLVGRKKEVCG